ncbi:MAG: DUF3617 domain-containing protein [Rhodospirillaceae bacterium]
MRIRMLCVFFLVVALPARADTSVQAGRWEKTETVTVDGTRVPSQPRSVCLKAGEASLERLLLINDDEAKARGCTSEIVRPAEARVLMTMSCPASDSEPAVDVSADVRFTPTSFEGTGKVLIKGKGGPDRKGTSVLAGKRSGDC